MQILVPERQPRRRLNLTRWLVWGVFTIALLVVLYVLTPILKILILGHP